MSLGADLPHNVRFWFFNVICGIFLAGLAIVTLKNKRTINTIAMTLILGGGIGNLIDRLTFGDVTDFLFVRVGPLHTGIFNIADMAIVLGIILLTPTLFLKHEQKRTS